MERSRKLALSISACLILNCPLLKARAQQSPNPLDDSQATEKLVDAWIGVATMAFPEAGLAFEATKKLMDMMGFFDKPDATGEALKKINERLTKLEGRVSNLEAQVNALQNRQFRDENWNRIQLLKTKRELLQGLVLQLQGKPSQADVKRGLANAVGNIADDFLDIELWKWSDMREKDGMMPSPDFKSLPTLELYVTTLAAWIGAIEYAGDGDYEFVKRTYGPRLRRHIAFLSERPGWTQGDEAQTLPENLKNQAHGSIVLKDKYPKNRTCT